MFALVIDSSASSRRELLQSLRSLGVEAHAAGQVRTAVQALQSTVQPDVVFCEHRLSDGASDLFQSLRNLQSHREVSVVTVFRSQDESDAVPVGDIPGRVRLTRTDDLAAVSAALTGAGLQLPQPVKLGPVGNPALSDHVSDRDTQTAAVRVLAVDPSSLVRRLVSKVIRDTDGFDLAATAQDGAAALEKIERLAPDIVTLDLVMPVLDGFETIEQIRQRWPHLPIVVFSEQTLRSDEVKRKCLLLGANDQLDKPEAMPDLQAAEDWLRQNLVPRLAQFFPGVLPARNAARSKRDEPTAKSGDTIRIVSDTQVIKPKPTSKK